MSDAARGARAEGDRGAGRPGGVAAAGEAERDAFIVAHTEVVAPPLVPEIPLHLATELTALWTVTEAWLDAHGVPPPYWAFAWAGGQALARHVLDRPEIVRGRDVLDFASGSGIVAIAAAIAGARRVVATDLDALSLRAIARNAARAGVAIEVEGRDVIDDGCDGFDVVLAGDVCYEQPMSTRVLPWLARLARAGKTVLVGEPGRTYAPTSGVVEVARYDVETVADVEGVARKIGRVLRVAGA